MKKSLFLACALPLLSLPALGVASSDAVAVLSPVVSQKSLDGNNSTLAGSAVLWLNASALDSLSQLGENQYLTVLSLEVTQTNNTQTSQVYIGAAMDSMGVTGGTSSAGSIISYNSDWSFGLLEALKGVDWDTTDVALTLSYNPTGSTGVSVYLNFFDRESGTSKGSFSGECTGLKYTSGTPSMTAVAVDTDYVRSALYFTKALTADEAGSISAELLPDTGYIRAAQDFDNYSSLGESNGVRLILGNNVNVRPSGEAEDAASKWTSAGNLVSGGDVILTSASGEEGLRISGGQSAAFATPMASGDGFIWSIERLAYLELQEIASTSSSDVYGGAISIGTASSSAPINWLSFSDNGDITLSGNSASSSLRSASGGAIYVGNGAFEMRGNGNICFFGNQALGSNTASWQSANGGALYLAGSVSGSISNNTGNVVFEDNLAKATASNGIAYGGAIFVSKSLDISDNAGKVRFSGNGVEADKQAQGGAIYNSNFGGPLVISGNLGGVEFTGNYVSSLNTSSNSNVNGGAIYAGALSITGNGDVSFTGNHADSAQANNGYLRGGAIYAAGSLSITGNGDVVFDGNYEKRGDAVVMVAVQHAISSNAELNLSAGADKTITFYDALYSGKSYSTASGNVTANLNAEAGATGSIIFSGAHTRENLAAVWADYTEAALETSLHSSIMAASTTLYQGKLVVEEGAKLSTQNFTSNATLSLSNGTFDASGYTATLSAGSTLELSGLNAMAAEKLVVGDGVTIDISLSDAHRNTAALTLTPGTSASMADISDKLTLNLDGLAGTRQVAGLAYKLLTVENAASYLSTDWSVDNITVTGEGAAKGNIALDAATGTLGYYIWTTVVDAQTADESTKSFTAGDCEAAASNTLVRSGYNYYLDQSLNAARQGDAGYGYANGYLTVEEGAYAYVEAENPVSVADMAQLEKNGSGSPARITDANIGEAADGNREFTARLENTRVLLSPDEAEVISQHLELDNSIVTLAGGTSLRIDDLVVSATSSVAPAASTLGETSSISVAKTASVVLDATVDAVDEDKATLTSTQVGILLEEGAAMTLTFTKGLLDQLGMTEGAEKTITLLMEGMSYAGDTPLISLDFSQAPGYSFDEENLVITQEPGGTQIVFAVSYTPEPATTTLTLLALAAMAARRRRRMNDE